MELSFRNLAIAILLLSAVVLNAQTGDFGFDNTAQKEGLFVESTSTGDGCDSIVALHLIINEHDEGDFEAEACDSYKFYMEFSPIDK